MSSPSARIELLRGQVAYSTSLGGDAPSLLLKAARRLEPLNLELARETYIDAWMAAFSAGQPADDNMTEICRAARALPRSRDPGPAELLLHGLAVLVTDGQPAAASALRHAVSAFAGDSISTRDRLRWTYMALLPAGVLWDEEGWSTILARHLQLARNAGALDRLPHDLSAAGFLAAWIGDFGVSASLMAEADAVCEATGTRYPSYMLLLLVCCGAATRRPSRLSTQL
jgi:hypothetical protein